MAPRVSSTVPPTHKFDPAEQFRTEIEERTALGETCEQIATALRAQGISITSKTVSRRRVEWGMRKRPFHKLKGTKSSKPIKQGSKNSQINVRKAEIVARTQRGETAEQIAAALIAQGHELKKGASTITRLQTQYDLIPYDETRAGHPRGHKKKTSSTEPRVKKPKIPKVSKREMEREANKQQQTQTMHYPTNCSFGPQKRANGTDVDQDDDSGLDPDLESAPLPFMDDYSAPAASQQQQHQTASKDVSAEIMSVDFLVDLANSTLGAANNLKDMLLAYQAQMPIPNSSSSRPPTLEDLATARKKVREAAAVMHDLAADPGTSSAPS